MKYLLILLIIIPDILLASIFTSEEWKSMYLRECPVPDNGAVCFDKTKRNFKSLARYQRMILGKLNKYGLPRWFGTIPFIESEFVNSATSHQGAVGLWQIMPRNLQHYLTKKSKKPILGWYIIRKPTIDKAIQLGRDPEKNTEVACKLLSELWMKYKKYGKNRAKYTLMAYNAGEPKVDRWIAGKGTIKPETMNYYYQLMALQQILDDMLGPNSFGLR